MILILQHTKQTEHCRSLPHRLRHDLEWELRARAGVPWGLLPELLLALLCGSSLNLPTEVDGLCLDSRQGPVMPVLLPVLWPDSNVDFMTPEGLVGDWGDTLSEWNVLGPAAAACAELNLWPDCFLLTEVSICGFRSGFFGLSPHASDVLGYAHSEEVSLSMAEELNEDAGTTRVVMKVSWRVGTEALRPDESFLEFLTWVLTITSLFTELTELLRDGG